MPSHATNVQQFLHTRTLYLIYCRRCGSKDSGGHWHIAGIHPVRSGFNCDPCYRQYVR